MNLLRILPKPEKSLIGADLKELYSWPNKFWVRASMVQDLTGSITDASGSAANLSTPGDKEVFRNLRQLCDLILVGAKTAMSAPYLNIKINAENAEVRKSLKMTPKPRVAIVSNELSITKEWLKTRVDNELPLIYTHQDNESKLKNFLGLAEFVFTGQRQVVLSSVKDDLTRRFLNKVVCEGGPQLLHGLVANNVLDEIALSIVPFISGSPDLDHVLHGSAFQIIKELTPIQILQAEQTLLLRYLLPGRKF